MDIHISLMATKGLAEQIYDQLRTAILDGHIRPREAVPSTRELAARLAVSRNTVNVAYDRLAAEGFLTTRTGARTYVSDGALRPVHRKPQTTAGELQPRRIWRAQPEPVDMSAVSPRFDFRPGIPDARRFPFPAWRALFVGALRKEPANLGAYHDPAGHPRLRAAIARHIAVSRGISVVPDNVIVTTGSQQAIDLIGRVLLEPGDVAVVEDPGWLPPKALFETAGARVVAVPVDEEGVVVEMLPAKARILYCSPSHQFPLGVAMSLRRRLEVLHWANRAGALIIEDDYDSEFRYVGRPVEPLHSLDDSGRVLYVGSFSKTLLPALRLGFCVPPPSLHSALRRAKYVIDWHTALPSQIALARFIDDGLFARHIRRMRCAYQARRDRISAILDLRFVDLLKPVPSVAGLHLTARVRDSMISDRAVAEHARRAGVGLYPLSDFTIRDRSHTGLVLGYGALDPDRVDEGLGLLRLSLEDVARRGRSDEFVR